MKQWQVGEFRLSNTTVPEAQRAKIADTAETAVLSVTCASLLFFFFFFIAVSGQNSTAAGGT